MTHRRTSMYRPLARLKNTRAATSLPRICRFINCALMLTTFYSKYIIHESLIDNLWAQRSYKIHICKDKNNNNVMRDRLHSLMWSTERMTHVCFSPLSMRKTFPISAWRLLCSPSSTCSLHDSYAICYHTDSSIISLTTSSETSQVKLKHRTAPSSIVQSRRPLRTGRRASEGGAERCRLSSPTAGPPPAWCGISYNLMSLRRYVGATI